MSTDATIESTTNTRMKEYKFPEAVFFQEGPGLRKWQWTEDGMKVINVKNINENGSIDTNNSDRYISNDEFSERYTHFAIEANDILVAGSGNTYGKIGRIRSDQLPVMMNTSVIRFHSLDKDLLDDEYLYAFLRSPLFKNQIERYVTGSAQPNFGPSHIKQMVIPIPELNKQKTIGNVISNYDNLIENNNRRIAILEDMAQSLYREWFVKFRYLGYQDNLDADGSLKLVDSPLGQIPEGWEVKRLDDFVTLQRGFDLPKKKRNEKGCVPIYAASGINGYHDQVKAKGPGIVTGRSGTLGIVNLVLEDHWPLNTSLWVKEFKGCTAFYAYYVLDSIGLERFNSGASVPTLNRNDVHGNPVIAPPKELIKKFENIVCVNHKQINVLKRKNENLKKQRAMLLPRLISGDIEL